MALLRLLAGALLALLLAAPSAKAGSPASTGSKDLRLPLSTCVFGMPKSGYAINSEDTGFITAVLKAAMAPAGYQLVYKDLPYRRAQGELNKGRIHCTLTAKGAPNASVQARSVIAACDLSVAYVAADGFTGLKDLAGQKVAHLCGYDFADILPVDIQSQPTYDRISVIHMLDRGHVRYAIGEESLLRQAVIEAGLPMSEFGFARFMSLDVVPAFAPTSEGFRMREIFDRRMAEMTASGELVAIYRKYGLPEDRIRHILRSDRY